MNTPATANPNPALAAPAEPPPQIWIGLDWGDQKHSFALQEHSGHYQEGTLDHS